MARQKERYNAIAERTAEANADMAESCSVITGKSYRVALYARLSVERADRKSDSIESQFMIMENFIKDKPELSQYQKYFDRGVSGTTFSRPDFIRMMDDVKTGRINCIIVKDLSRFGRDYLETGNYIETILPFLGVRFISVNDHFDTEGDTNGNKGLGISLMNLVNDMYAKDVSKRVSTAVQSCIKRGSVLGNCPYGYDKIKTEAGYRLVIDEPAAEIVRMIFGMARNGMSQQNIAEELVKKRVHTPQEYKKTQLIYVEEGEPVTAWEHGVLSQILANEVYIGTLVQGKRNKCLYKGVKEHRVEKDNWIRHEQAHEAIITKEEFEEVRAIINAKREKMTVTFREDLPKTEDKYKGILKCSVCGRNMYRESTIVHTETGDVRRYSYRCRHGRVPLAEKPREIIIFEEQIDMLVSESLQKLMKELVPDKKRILSVLEKQNAQMGEQYKSHILDLKKRRERLEYDGSMQYGRYVKGEITKEELTEGNRMQTEQMERIDAEILAAEEDYRLFVEKQKEQKKFVNALLSAKQKPILTAELLAALIVKIELKPDRCMEIWYRFSYPNKNGNYSDTFAVPRKKRNDAGRRRKNG